MTVTEVREISRQKVCVEFDHQLTLVLYRGELKRYGLREGAEVPDGLPDEIEEQVLRKRATRYAMNLLAKRDYAARELRDKLCRAGYTEETAGHALAYVTSFGYINDADYARRYLETYSDRKSLRRMEADLRQKGISEEIMVSAMAEADCTDEKETLRRYAVKKAAALDLSLEKNRQKFFRYLTGKGFSYGDVKDVLEELQAEGYCERSEQ